MTEGKNERKGPDEADLQAALRREGGGRELRIGLFVLLGLISFVTVLFLLTDPATLRGRYMVVTELTDAGGIRRGDPVQMRGVNIGRVHGFEMTPDGRVAVTLEIEGDWRIPVGSEAVLAESGLFGGRTMAIVPSDADAMLAAFDTVAGRDEGGGLMDTAGRVGTEAEVVLRRLAVLLDSGTVTSVQGSARGVEALTRELRGMLEEQRDEVADLIGSLGRAASGIERLTDEAGPELAGAAARADSLLAGLEGTRGRLDGALTSLEAVLARMERGEGTLGLLSSDDALYVNLNRAAASLDSLLVDVRRNPGRYLRLQLF